MSDFTSLQTQDICSWISCTNQAYATWSRKGYCYSCYREIMDSKD